MALEILDNAVSIKPFMFCIEFGACNNAQALVLFKLRWFCVVFPYWCAGGSANVINTCPYMSSYTATTVYHIQHLKEQNSFVWSFCTSSKLACSIHSNYNIRDSWNYTELRTDINLRREDWQFFFMIIKVNQQM